MLCICYTAFFFFCRIKTEKKVCTYSVQIQFVCLFFAPSIFCLWLFNPVAVDPVAMEDQLCVHRLSTVQFWSSEEIKGHPPYEKNSALFSLPLSSPIWDAASHPSPFFSAPYS